MSHLRFTILLASLWACGGTDGPCDPHARTGCGDGQVCEQVANGTPTCFAPVLVQGRVLDLTNTHAIAGARVEAVDVNGAAVSSVTISGSDGKYVLPVPIERAADGTLSALSFTLRADAAGFQTFPNGVREALPIDVSAAMGTAANGFTLQSTLTDIGLIPLPAGSASGSIHGTAAIADDHAGVLVVAETAGKGSVAIASLDGDYAILNLAPAHYTVTAYARGHVYTPREIDVATGDVKVDLSLAGDVPGSVSGQVSIVNGGGSSMTSVVLFVESTFDTTTGRGVVPPGLRAPNAGVPNVTGAFTIDQVPPGKYVAVAAFENDGLVRDPDLCIAGTTDAHVTVVANQPASLTQTFKVTGALAVVAPGANLPEAVAATPMFSWSDDAGEDQYLIEVFDAFGQLTWSTTIPGVSGGSPTLTYAGPALAAGMYYQFRVTSSKQQGAGQRCALSRTEDLRGVFYIQ
ncbi:MAG: hypothetical protein JWO36_2506 [Myxococcales bacterium]|nr:hypothetical protein [Myxococcales bacterium]